MTVPRLGRVGVVAALAGAAIFGGAASATPPDAVNLIATPRVKAALRAAHIRGMKPAEAARVRGPLHGSVYYGRVGEHYYALATFDGPLGTVDQPEGFDHVGQSPWRDLGEGFGDITCKGPQHTRIPPLVLLRDVWHLCGPGHV